MMDCLGPAVEAMAEDWDLGAAATNHLV